MAAPILPFDTAERHCVAATLLGSPRNALDVGGRPGELARFLPSTGVTTANVDPPADVLFTGSELPFPEDSFEVVSSLDVLEHLERPQRQAHIAELVRVARERVVVCCPLGTPAHVEAERELAARYEHRFIKEHLEKGLPEEEELRVLVSSLSFRFELLFHGDFRTVNERFVLERGARALRPRALLDYAVKRARWKPDLELAAESNPFTNRAFLIGSR
jgi:SAM-dependent methyltransferase